MSRYTVYTSSVSYLLQYKPWTVELGSDTPVYHRRVNATSRLEALNKCLPDLQAEFPKLNCRYLSVFVGESANPSAAASRMHPFQIDTETGQIRGHK